MLKNAGHVDVDGSIVVDFEEVRRARAQSLHSQKQIIHVPIMQNSPHAFSPRLCAALRAHDHSIASSLAAQFCSMYGMVVVEQKEAAGAELYDCFRVLDRDGNGYIERDELMAISKQTSRVMPHGPVLHTHALLLGRLHIGSPSLVTSSTPALLILL